jgi:Flp pilus assembly protein TadG
MTTKQQIKKKFGLNRLARDERGVAAVIFTMFLPVIVGLFTFATDMAFVYFTRNLLQVAAESAALAASTQLPDKNAAITFAKSYAAKNMDSTVLRDADVIVGKWTDGCAAGGQNCFVAAGAVDCQTFACNAVKVTTQRSTTNGNSLKLVFAPLVGYSTFDVTATAIATFGPGPGAQTKWFVTIIEDISQSFSQQLSNAKAADLALMDCIKNNSAAGSKLGIALFTGTSPAGIYAPQVAVSDSTNYNNMKTKINNIQQCGGTGMPACSGSNVSSGMNAAITSMCPQASTCPLAASTQTSQALVIITDGIPNCSSSIPNCSNSTLLANAVAAADKAKSEGIDVFTVYYGTSSSDAAWLATLIRGNGKAFTTPTPSQLAGLMQQVCSSSLSHRLVW